MHPHSGPRLRALTVAALLLLVSAPTGCAAPTPSTPVDQGSGASTTAAGSTDAAPTIAPQPGPPGGNAPPVADAPVIRWVPLGPAAPSDPPEGALYELVRARDCAGLRDSTSNTGVPEVWAAAQATCFALASDTAADWNSAAAALAAVPPVGSNRCWESVVLGSVRQAIEFRKANPAVAVPLATRGVGDDCPRRLTGLTVLDQDGNPVTGAGLPSGSSAGGTRVRLEGFIVRADRILGDGVQLEDVSAPLFGPVEITTPPAAAGQRTLRITVEASPPVSGEATFFYDDGGAPAASPTPAVPASSAPAGVSGPP
jgi:hypothetical protein